MSVASDVCCWHIASFRGNAAIRSLFEHRGLRRSTLGRFVGLRPSSDTSFQRPEQLLVSLSQTPSSWRLIENRAMLLLDVRFVQTDLWNGDRPAAVASCAGGRNSGLEATNQRVAANPSQETSVCTENLNTNILVMQPAQDGA